MPALPGLIAERFVEGIIMAEHKEITIQAKPRAGRGKNDARRTRRTGLVPVTVYGGEGGTVARVVAPNELAAPLRSATGREITFNLHILGGGGRERTFSERQFGPIPGP